MLVNNFYLLFEGNLEVKLPTTWTDGKAEVAKVKEEKRREETRCSLRTRMLIRMLMIQMSKHMDMQSRRTLCGKCRVWSGKCGVWSV